MRPLPFSSPDSLHRWKYAHAYEILDSYSGYPSQVIPVIIHGTQQRWDQIFISFLFVEWQIPNK